MYVGGGTMKVINILITDEQRKWLDENSVTKSKSLSGKGLTLSEHIRKAIDEYISKGE